MQNQRPIHSRVIFAKVNDETIKPRSHSGGSRSE